MSQLSNLTLFQTAVELKRILAQELQKQNKLPLLVSLIAGAAAGKGMIARALQAIWPEILIIDLDNYLLGSRIFRRQLEQQGNPVAKYNPELLRQNIASLQAGESVILPKKIEPSGEALNEDGSLSDNPARQFTVSKIPVLILVMGDFQFIDPDFSLYLHMSDAERLASRIQRDSASRGSDPREVKHNFLFRQQTQHIPYTLPQLTKAQVVITAKKENDIFLHTIQVK